MALSPATASVTGSIVIGAPFKSMGSSIQISTSVAGCGAYKVEKAPSWNKKTGEFRTAASSTASGCASPGIGTVAQWYTYLDLEQPITISANRAYQVNETWLVSATDSWNLTPYKSCKLNYAAPSSDCLATAGSEIYSYTIFEDLTNYSETFSFVTFLTNFSTVENYTYCSGSPCTPSGGNFSSGALSGSFSTTFYGYNNFTTAVLNSTHKYEIYVVFLAETFAETQLVNAKAKGTASAAAAFNMGKGGDRAKLLPIRIV